MKIKIIIIFVLILLLGVTLRTYKVTEIPPGINRDEGSIAYTAYSLLHTGKDEYGLPYPISFQSFGDWKLPLYLYSVVPAVALFGLNELSVRLTSIIAGCLTVALTFFLIKEMFGNRLLAFVSMFLVAVAPWHIHLSRVESESNTAVFLTTLAVFLFLKGLKKNSYLLVISAVLLALTYYTYAGNYIFTSLLVLGLGVIYYKKVPTNKWFFTAIGIFSILSFFIFSQTVLGANKTKLSGIGIFGDPSIIHAQIEIPRNEHNEVSLFSRIVHNKYVFAGEKIVQNYLNSFSPDFLFVKGGTNNAHNIQNFGNMYVVESLFLFTGFMYLITQRKKPEVKLVLWWFLIAPVAASITKDAPHTNRTFAIFPILPVVTAFGIWYFWNSVEKFKWKYLIAGLVSLLFLINILLYVDRYFVHFPKNEAESWGIGYKALNEFLTNNPEKKAVISRPEYSPYIFLLFYSRYDPKKYISEAERYPLTSDGFLHVKKYGRFEFKEVDWSNDIKRSNTFLIAHPSEVPEFVKGESFKKSYISLPDGSVQFVVVDLP